MSTASSTRFDPAKHPDPSGKIWYAPPGASRADGLGHYPTPVLTGALERFEWPKGSARLEYDGKILTQADFDAACARIRDELASRGVKALADKTRAELRCETQEAIEPDDIEVEITCLHGVEHALRPLSTAARARVLAYFVDREVGAVSPRLSSDIYEAAHLLAARQPHAAVAPVSPPGCLGATGSGDAP